ncbi:MAG: quinolinate synthase NadA [Candidatus Stahlbacteria bacterium]|nr:MAG: quinolinate synthase NadA [Candidatus Stahlbacteria bacterium]
MNVQEEITRLKEEKNAIILVHNYQRPKVQDVADYLGDSLGLSRKASNTNADMIVFCGVTFMAETAKILSPDKTVLLPRKEAGCPMADMVTSSDVIALKEKYPDAKVVSYVNTNADVKAVTDVCCTSSNAVEVVRNIEADRVIFVPDRNLASYVGRFVDKEIIPWDGYCYVHERITKDEVLKAKEKYPDALLLVHPECNPPVIDIADEVLSTQGMVDFVGESDNKRFLIGTEEGILYRLKKENPDKEFYPAGTPKICQNMKRTTLDDVYLALKDEQYPIEIPDEIISSAKRALEAMLQYV